MRRDACRSPIATAGRSRPFPNKNGGYDLDGAVAVSAAGQVETSRYDRATVLLEPDTPYDTLVQVMDRVRVLEVNAG